MLLIMSIELATIYNKVDKFRLLVLIKKVRARQFPGSPTKRSRQRDTPKMLSYTLYGVSSISPTSGVSPGISVLVEVMLGRLV